MISNVETWTTNRAVGPAARETDPGSKKSYSDEPSNVIFNVVSIGDINDGSVRKTADNSIPVERTEDHEAAIADVENELLHVVLDGSHLLDL